MLNQMNNAPVQSSIPSTPPIKLWTPGFIAGITFLLGFPAGLVIASINWMKMNLSNKAILHLVLGAIGAFLFTVILIIIPGTSGRIAGLAVNLGILFYLQQQMKKDIESFKSSNPVENAGQLGGCLIGLVVLVLFVGMVFIVGFILAMIGVPIPE